LSTDIADEDKSPALLNIDKLRSRCKPFDVRRFYDDIKHFADYGPDYRRITALAFNDDEACADVRASTSSRYALLPPLLRIFPDTVHAAAILFTCFIRPFWTLLFMP
jgi:hypothetical protein